MRVEHRQHVLALDPAHAALGADAPLAPAEVVVDDPHLLGGRVIGLLGRVIGHEREVQLGLVVDREVGERREERLVADLLRDRDREEVDEAGACGS